MSYTNQMLDWFFRERGFVPEVFKTFDVYHLGWECDSCGWIVGDSNFKVLVLTNHGDFYFGKPYELNEKLIEYNKVTSDTLEALTLLK